MEAAPQSELVAMDSAEEGDEDEEESSEGLEERDGPSEEDLRIEALRAQQADSGGAGSSTAGSDAAAQSAGAAARADGAAADGEPVHSVYVVLPEGFEGIPIDVIFDDATQTRILDTCRRSLGHDGFRRLWPSGRRDFLEAMRRGLEESGRGTVARALRLGQARALVARLTDFVAAELGVDREGAALVAGGPAGEGGGAGAGAGGAGGAAEGEPDANARIYSVLFVLPDEMRDMLDVILPEILPRMVDVCRRHRDFQMSWPAGPAEMERSLRERVAQSGRGPLLHGMRRTQAEAVRDQLADLFAVEVVMDREAAARVQERERRSRPPPRPPPTALLARLPPGARVRVAAVADGDGGVAAVQELQRGFGGLGEEARACLGREGVVAAYAPAEHSAWAVRVTCALDSGSCSYSWNPSNVALLLPVEAEAAGAGEGAAASAGGQASSAAAAAQERCAEVLLAGGDDLLAGDPAIFHLDGVWQAGRVVAVGSEDAPCTVTAVDGHTEHSVMRRHVHAVVALEAPPEALSIGAVVQITASLEEARSMQRGRWSDELERCLGQRGTVVEIRDHHRVVVNCPSLATTTTWATPCLRIDRSQGLLCLDLHDHPLWWCSGLARPGACAACGEAPTEAFCCLRPGSDARVCGACAAAYAPAPGALAQVHSRHHLRPLVRAALPRGLAQGKWPCAGELTPGGCRGARAVRAAAQPVDVVWADVECEFVLCSACLEDEALGEATEETRRADLEGLPRSAPRIAAALRRHPSEVFALAEAGLFTSLAASLADDRGARGLALDLGAWLAAAPPTRADVGPTLVETEEGTWAEAHVVSEEADDFGGTWTDEKEPGRWIRSIEGDTIYPAVVGAEARGAAVLEVSGCGIPEFNGQYVPDGTKNNRTKFRKACEGLQTCNYSDGSWYLCHNHSGSWYECRDSSAYSATPPSSGWVVGERGQAPAPVVTCKGEAAPRPFRLLPSVGSWLRRRLDVDPEVVAGPEARTPASPSGGPSRRCLDGIWLREASGDHVVIEGGVVTWPDGGTTPLGAQRPDGRSSIELRGQAFTARLEPTISQLVSSEGDAWTRVLDTTGRQPESPPEVGSPVKFRGFAGCTIKQVLGRRKVLIHIPGVGDQEATLGEYSLSGAGVHSSADGSSGSTQLAKLQRLSKDAFCVELGGMSQCAQLTADGGRLVWADGGSTWVNIARCPRCPAGHLLRRARHAAPWHCKDCTERLGERQRLRCASCDYDVCDACVAVRSWEQAPSAGSGEAPYAEGEEAEVCPAGGSPSAAAWVRCRVEAGADAKGLLKVRVLGGEASEAGGAADELREVPAGRLRRCDWALKVGPVDALWRYASPTNNPIGIRMVPKIEGQRDGQMKPGEVFRVSEHRKGADGVLFLRLADGRGWVFDKKPSVGLMCVLLRAREACKQQAPRAVCRVALSSPERGGADGALPPAGAQGTTPVPLERLRPAFPAGHPRTSAGDFLRADLLRELGRGPLSDAGRVKGLLEGRANLLAVEGGENPLGAALRYGCKAGVLEALLLAHAPLAGQSTAELAFGGASSSSSSPPPRAAGAAAQEPLGALAADPRLAALLAERGAALARFVAEAVARHPVAGPEAQAHCEDSASVGTGAQADAAAEAAASALAEAARSCAGAARRLSETLRPTGSISALLRQFGASLLTPLLEAGASEVLQSPVPEVLAPSGPLGGLLRALGASGYELSDAQADRIAALVALQLALDRDEAICGLLGFVRLLLESFRSAGVSEGPPSSSLRRLCAAFRRHGITAAAEQLADPAAEPWLERVDLDQDALWSTVVDIVACLREVELDPPSPDAAVVAAIERLPAREALEELAEALASGRCTPYELGVLRGPERILPMFEASAQSWPWPSEPPMSESAARVLAASLQVLLGISETFPVWGAGMQGEGLDCLLRPHALVLDGAAGRRELRVEPLLPLADLERFTLQSATPTDVAYLDWCQALCGRRIADGGPAGTAAATWEAALVLRFGREQGLPVHTVRYEASGREASLLLHLRRVVVLGPPLGGEREVGGASDEPQATSPEHASSSGAPVQFGAGSQVQARFRDGTWCRATVEKDVGDGTFRIRWENGTQTDTAKGPDDLRPLPGGGRRTCQRVQVTRDGGTAAGIAVWEHTSGALDVVDQEGRFLAAVPRSKVVAEARHAQDSSGRPVPLEIRSLSVPEHERAPPAPLLERTFSAVDRDYRPRDFQYRNPARKIGGPDGEPLQGPDAGEECAPERSPRSTSLLEEVAAGSPAPRLRVVFRRAAPPGAAQAIAEECRSPERGAGTAASASSATNPASCPASPEKQAEAASPQPQLTAEETAALQQPLPPTSTVLQALLDSAVGGFVDLPDSLWLWYEVCVDTGDEEAAPQPDGDAPHPAANSSDEPSQPSRAGADRSAPADDAGTGANDLVAPALRLLGRLRRCLPEAAAGSQDASSGLIQPGGGVAGEEEDVRWESGPLNRKLMDQLAQPLLTAAVAAPAWVCALPLAYPFLFERGAREQLLRLLGFGTSHAVLWMQRQSIEDRYGDRLRRAEGLPMEGRMDLQEHIVSDHEVFIGPARSDLVTLPTRGRDLLRDAQRVVELTYTSKATLEVQFADEGGFGDGVTQSFYTTVASELLAVADGDTAAPGPCAASPLCGAFGLWTEHLPASVTEYRGRTYLHSHRGLFPRPLPQGGEGSEYACGKFRFLGRLMAKALRDGFTVPLPLSGHFFAAVLGEDLPLEALASPGDGCVGEFIGAAAKFSAALRRRHAGLAGEELTAARTEAAGKAGWGQEFLGLSEGDAMTWSFDQYVSSCGVVFCETGLGGPELCPGGGARPLDVHCLEEFVELAARWWLRDGVAAQVAAFRAGVEDVCQFSTVWAFEANELAMLFCGGHTEWTREELLQHLRPTAALGAPELQQLAEVLARMTPTRRARFLEFVTACPRLPPGGLAAAEISVAPANPPGSLPRARTCTKELRLPKYSSAEELEERLNWAIDNAEGLYEYDRLG